MSEQEALRRKNDELAQAYKDKSRKLLQTQELYDKAKRKSEIGMLQRAASDAVDSTLSGAHLHNRREEGSPVVQNDSLHSMPPPSSSSRVDNAGMNTGIQRTSVRPSGDGPSWGRLGVPSRGKCGSDQPP
jgi:E3 ubiquitin-protein ligase CCNP1IP1